jgi:hypothetical protein
VAALRWAFAVVCLALPAVLAVFLPAFRCSGRFFCGAALRFPGRGGLVAFFRLALPCVVFAAVLRRPPALRAIARAPAPAFLFDGVSFRVRTLPLVPVRLVVFFFAI